MVKVWIVSPPGPMPKLLLMLPNTLWQNSNFCPKKLIMNAFLSTWQLQNIRNNMHNAMEFCHVDRQHWSQSFLIKLDLNPNSPNFRNQFPLKIWISAPKLKWLKELVFLNKNCIFATVCPMPIVIRWKTVVWLRTTDASLFSTVCQAVIDDNLEY